MEDGMVIGSHDSTRVFTILSKPKGKVEHRTGMLVSTISVSAGFQNWKYRNVEPAVE
jgi:hypothetical protein